MIYNELDLVILKTLLTNKKHAIDFANESDAKLFTPEIWNCAHLIVSYIKTYKDIPTLRVITERLSKGNNKSLVEHINQVWNQIDKITYDEKEYKYDLERLKKRFAEKQIANIKDTLNKLDPGSIDINKTVNEFNKTIQSITGLNGIRAYESKNIKDYLPDFVEKFNSKKDNPEVGAGLKTGYSFFDYATNGLKAADFIIIAGESGFGKSLFLKNLAMQTWLQGNTIDQVGDFTSGKDIIYFSLEMPYEDCFNRLLSRLSGVPSRSLENAKLSKDEFARVKKCLDFIKRYPYQFKIVDIADAKANDLEAILENCEEAFDAIFIDYLGIMKSNENKEEQDWLKQGIIAYEVRAIARKYRLPVFSAVQLNRKAASKESSENIGLSRLARSGTIATHATHVIQIENRTQEELYPDFLYHVIKNRKGPKGKGVLIKNLSCATLLDKPMEEGIKDDQYDKYFTERLDDISEEMEDLEL